MEKTKVLMLTNYYLPCLNSGGPVVTMQNMVNTFCGCVDFFFCCLNHDMNSTEEYKVETNTFLDKKTYHIMYIKKFTKPLIKQIILENDFNVVCCFGLYSFYTRIIIADEELLNKSKIIIFPMGSFSQSAINHKKIKKEVFFLLFKKRLLSPKISWSFTDKTEFLLANKKLKKLDKNNCYFCPDLVVDTPKENTPNTKSLVFISRIMEIKGLYESIVYLKSISYDGAFDIYGPIEDNNYWNKCKNELLTSTIQWQYKGVLKHDEIIDIFSQYKIFLFFTKGENFGHVVFESLCGGCLPIITKETTIWDSWLERIPAYTSIRSDLRYYFSLEDSKKRQIIDECKVVAREYLDSQTGDYQRMFIVDD